MGPILIKHERRLRKGMKTKRQGVLKANLESTTICHCLTWLTSFPHAKYTHSTKRPTKSLTLSSKEFFLNLKTCELEKISVCYTHHQWWEMMTTVDPFKNRSKQEIHRNHWLKNLKSSQACVGSFLIRPGPYSLGKIFTALGSVLRAPSPNPLSSLFFHYKWPVFSDEYFSQLASCL